MDSTISVSKGCFVFKNGATHVQKVFETTKKEKQSIKSASLDKEPTDHLFYSVYTDTWSTIKKDIEELQKAGYEKPLEDLVQYVKDVISSRSNEIEFLPTAALLTGINQPDHYKLFQVLSQQIKNKMPACVCTLYSRDCLDIKSAIESMVHSFLQDSRDNSNEDNARIRKSECTMKRLCTWYHNITNNRAVLVIILPDFESFIAQVLQDFILILCGHCSDLPIMLVLGVATSVSALHNTLPYHVTSKIKIKVFKTQMAPTGMNEIFEKVVLSPKYAFHLSGKAIQFLANIFLYYDFSLNGFINGFKYCIMEHFFQRNACALCSGYSTSLETIKRITHSELETIRHLMSFRPYVEANKDGRRVTALLTDDAYLRRKLPKLLRCCHQYFINFRICVEFLTIMVSDLPKCPLGKYRREVYSACSSKNILEEQEFKDCWQMISFLSKGDLVTKITLALTTTRKFIEREIICLELGKDCQQQFNEKLSKISSLVQSVVDTGMDVKIQQKSAYASSEEMKQLSRQELKEKLFQMAKQEKSVSQFNNNVSSMLNFIRDEVIAKFLIPLSCAPPLYELFVFTEVNAVRRNIVGAPRAALHTALNNPHFYLQCGCCELETNTQILPTLPELSVAYKLHLECGRMINLFDWLQAFRSVVDFSDEEQNQIDPKIQAAFTRAVAELQFLGYIKSSKRKTDHVNRLTW